MKHPLTLTLPALLASALALAGIAGAAATLTATDDVRIVLLHTNDIHGQLLPRMLRGRGGDEAQPVGGAAAIDAVVKQERARAKSTGAHVLLLDSGDWYQGTPEGNHKKEGAEGAVVVDWMNRAGFDAAVIGNHEFDFGLANLRTLMARAKFTVLGANVVAPVAAGGAASAGGDSKAPIAKPYVVLDRGGVKIALLGILDSDTPRMVAKGRMGDVTIPDEIEQSRLWFDRARKESDVVVMLTHCGKDTDRKIAERVPEAPVILGGHNHERIRQPYFVEHEPAALKSTSWKSDLPPRTYILQSGARAENLDRVELWIDPSDRRIRRIETKVTSLDVKIVGEDEETKKWIEAETAEVTKALDRVLAQVEPPAAAAEKGQRTDPTSNFMTDAMLWFARQTDPTVVAAFGNGGGVRAKLETGGLTARRCYEIVPFDNSLVLLTLSGTDLAQVLGESFTGDRPGRALSAGVVGVIRRAGDGRFDLSDVRIQGKAFDPAATYRVAANSFIAEGKGGFPTFAKGTDRVDTGVLVRDTLMEYATAVKRLALDDVLRLRFDGAGSAKPASVPAGAGAGGR
ncbi:MAG: bifunctional metallophosphatase/5'-nucleotidase [Planctomycetes bacterium]|nr:bifunctional metallophosphatase/5'-nucleotidase [Planctomycetota bacterium]